MKPTLVFMSFLAILGSVSSQTSNANPSLSDDVLRTINELLQNRSLVLDGKANPLLNPDVLAKLQKLFPDPDELMKFLSASAAKQKEKLEEMVDRIIGDSTPTQCLETGSKCENKGRPCCDGYCKYTDQSPKEKICAPGSGCKGYGQGCNNHQECCGGIMCKKSFDGNKYCGWQSKNG